MELFDILISVEFPFLASYCWCNYHKCIGFQPHTHSFLYSGYGLEVQHGSHWTKIKVSTRVSPGVYRENLISGPFQLLPHPCLVGPRSVFRALISSDPPASLVQESLRVCLDNPRLTPISRSET